MFAWVGPLPFSVVLVGGILIFLLAALVLPWDEGDQ